MNYIHSPQFNHHGTRLYPLFRRASSTGHYDSTWIQYFADEQRTHPVAMMCEKLCSRYDGSRLIKPTARPLILDDLDSDVS
uniref:Uncharacterized protein n=1 Tax=Caenorhabditis japonica TaxID=281687 RepID=A0A8R1EP57_CAEJA